MTGGLAGFITGGVAISIGVRRADGWPLSGFAHGARLVGTSIRVSVNRAGYAEVLAAVEKGSPIAATFTRAIDHRSIQLKARAGTVEPAGREDLAQAAAQSAAFRDELVACAYDASWSTLYMAFDRAALAVLSFVPDGAFVQTPGPGAGEALLP